MKAGGVIATMIASYLAGKVLYGTGKAISRALGGYPSNCLLYTSPSPRDRG